MPPSRLREGSRPTPRRCVSATDPRGRASGRIVGRSGGSLSELERERDRDVDLLVADVEANEVETPRHYRRR